MCDWRAGRGLAINTPKSKPLWNHTSKNFKGDYIWRSSLTQQARGNQICPGSNVSQTLTVAHSSVGIPHLDVAHIGDANMVSKGAIPGREISSTSMWTNALQSLARALTRACRGHLWTLRERRKKWVTTSSSNDSGTLSGEGGTRGQCLQGSIHNHCLGIEYYIGKIISGRQHYLALSCVHGQHNSHETIIVQLTQQRHAVEPLSRNHAMSRGRRQNFSCPEN